MFVDSPLAVNATDIFRKHVECFDDEMIDAILNEEDEDPLSFERINYVRSVEGSKALNRRKEPCVIISASGMCEGGRILHHLKNNIENPTTTVLFAGYQAPHTLGRILLDGNLEKVRIYGDEYTVRANVCKLDGSSGHGDQSDLVDWAAETCKRGNVKGIALVHCEEDSAAAFAAELKKRKLGPVHIPAPGDEMSMDG